MQTNHHLTQAIGDPAGVVLNLNLNIKLSDSGKIYKNLYHRLMSSMHNFEYQYSDFPAEFLDNSIKK
jgi:hypothetical protein